MVADLIGWGLIVAFIRNSSSALPDTVVWFRNREPGVTPDFADHSKTATAARLPQDDLSRRIYCVLGTPVDAVDTAAALSRIETAAKGTLPFLLSTPNLNFLANSLHDADFRESMLRSDLCTADGMPLIWIARLLGLPIDMRVAGSALFEDLCSRNTQDDPLEVFLFGGGEGVAEAAGKALNSRSASVKCVGSLYPGFGTIEEMSSDDVIDQINASKADFLVVALGAKKGQEWLLRNHDRIQVPVRSHLGAVMNFQAGTINRAPGAFQKFGFEWLWRIKEEPHLWKRYWKDGCALIRLFMTRALPLAIGMRLDRINPLRKPQELQIKASQDVSSTRLALTGDAVERHIDVAIHYFRDVLAKETDVMICDLSRVKRIDQRFLGLLLMVRKRAIEEGMTLKVECPSSSVRRMFRLNEAAHLLSEDPGGNSNTKPVAATNRGIAVRDA